LANVEKRVKTLIEKKHMFHPHRGEKLLVAASGGKDSQVLLSILKKIYPEGLHIEALYIELGINKREYSHGSGIAARKFCTSLDIPYHSLSVKDLHDISMDEIHKLKTDSISRDVGTDDDAVGFRGECSYCGTFKRYLINKYAVDHGFTAVATGHNLTDEATSLVNNFFNVDLTFLARNGPVNDSQVLGMVPRVKPLFYISEEEIMMYTYFANIPHFSSECPYALQSPNTKLKGVLKELELSRRGNMISLMRRYQKVMKPVIRAKKFDKKPAVNTCQTCGMTSLGKICSFCRTITTLNEQREHVQLDEV
jgi:uncharacterized protein (TIGR00269 family)